MNWIEQRKTTCQKCGAIDWRIDCVENKAGHKTHPLICKQCGYKTCVYVPKNIVETHAISVGVQLSYETPKDARTCDVCGEVGAEEHHWAPRYLFGDDCEKWPKGFLCQKCHSLWHKVMRFA